VGSFRLPAQIHSTLPWGIWLDWWSCSLYTAKNILYACGIHFTFPDSCQTCGSFPCIWGDVPDHFQAWELLGCCLMHQGGCSSLSHYRLSNTSYIMVDVPDGPTHLRPGIVSYLWEDVSDVMINHTHPGIDPVVSTLHTHGNTCSMHLSGGSGCSYPSHMSIFQSCSTSFWCSVTPTHC